MTALAPSGPDNVATGREITHQALRLGGLVAGAGVALGGKDKMNPAVMFPNHDMERTTANRAHPVPAVR